ncbi:hypothetical protein Pmani_023954 [Petrolisthes manimaculis]|uniref:Venom dipeptidyl peptidase 4 n=1 Tax=Petrolisthes manimaculis TaxID=1843537 RepID=A0AAE1PB18_9EUCA|nr:hypothetical protein Pmani_023954 [Petrolisthes manimaculis]
MSEDGIFRYSFKAKYHVYNTETGNHYQLTPTPEERGHPQLVLAKWAPVDSGIVMVDTQYNLHYKQSASDDEVHRLTDTGIPGVIFNGVPDWVYEEEILNSNSALWFAPDGKHLAYASLNDSLVETVTLPQYDSTHQYPSMHTLRYPKPGQENPKVTIWVTDLTNFRSDPRDLKPPNVVKDQDHYFTAVTWVDTQVVSVVWMNRAQNTSVVTSCAPPMYFCMATHTEHSGGHGWVELYDAPIYSNDGMSFLVRLPMRNGDQGEFKHVNLYNVRMRQVIPITHGAFEVTEILGWDQENNYIYFMATVEEKPGERHLFRVADVSSPRIMLPECLSCLEADNTTDTCLFNRAHFSKSFSYFVLECLGPDVPRVYLFSAWSAPEVIYTLDDNNEVRWRVAEMALPQVRRFKVQLEGGPEYTYHVQLYLPPGLREDEITTYPMVLYMYAAPGTQSVTSKFSISWGTYLASRKDIIYGMIDGRGSGFQGDKIKHEVYRELGGKEVDDQLAVVHYLRDNLHFIDAKRIAIWGWSYGGYVTTMALARDTDLFSCGIAVAPVARWEHYDSVYTERYMGSPHVYPGSNYKGYENADATKVVGNLRDKMFLLIHGTADDNVHYQHSMMLASALVHENVLFQQMTYPDEKHGLVGVKEHLYRTLDKFLSDCYRPSIGELYVLIKKKKKEIEEIGYL